MPAICLSEAKSTRRCTAIPSWLAEGVECPATATVHQSTNAHRRPLRTGTPGHGAGSIGIDEPSTQRWRAAVVSGARAVPRLKGASRRHRAAYGRSGALALCRSESGSGQGRRRFSGSDQCSHQVRCNAPLPAASCSSSATAAATVRNRHSVVFAPHCERVPRGMGRGLIGIDEPSTQRWRAAVVSGARAVPRLKGGSAAGIERRTVRLAGVLSVRIWLWARSTALQRLRSCSHQVRCNAPLPAASCSSSATAIAAVQPTLCRLRPSRPVSVSARGQSRGTEVPRLHPCRARHRHEIRTGMIRPSIPPRRSSRASGGRCRGARTAPRQCSPDRQTQD